MIATQQILSPYGELIIGTYKDQLCLCDWKHRHKREEIDLRIQSFLNTEFIDQSNHILEVTKEQLSEYFHKKRTTFDLPLLTIGTDFQKSVWNELINIPFGKTCSYLELSHKLNNPKAIRAVASANGANAISIIIPCHRIIGSIGELTGYAGGLSAKKSLLELDGNQLHIF